MSWPGGKDGAGVAQRLINELPPHAVFISPFLGDCAIMRRKRPAALSIGIDKSRANVERWAREQSRPDLRLFCCCGIAWLQHAFALHLVEPPPRPGQGPPPNSAPLEEFAARFAAPLPADAAANRAAVLVYLDPPYLIASRKSRRPLYQFELTEEDHAELLQTARRLPCLVMLSHYPHPLYARALRDWRTFKFRTTTRGGPAVEQVWCNYPPPVELHDARFVGREKRQRERIHRRVRNWTAGLARMLPHERQAVLDAIEARYFSRRNGSAGINGTPPPITASPAGR